MHSTLRILTLGLFGVAGAALAVALATRGALPRPVAAGRAAPAEPQPFPLPARALPLAAAAEIVPAAHQAPADGPQPAAAATDEANEPPSLFWKAANQFLGVKQPSSAAPTPAAGSADERTLAAPAAAAPAPAEAPAAEALPVPAAEKLAPQHRPDAAATDASASHGQVRGEGDGRLSINLQDTDLHKVLQLLGKQGALNILATKSVQGTVSASLNNVDLDTALAAILRSTGFVARRDGAFIYVGTPQDFQSMAQAGDRMGTRIYRPNYVRASELQALLTPLLTAGAGAIGVTSPAESGIAADSNTVGGDKYAGADAVVCRDFEAVLAQFDQIYEEVDRRPLQVAIEAMILSVKLNDNFSFGVDFQLLRDKEHIRLATGSPVDDLADISFSSGGLKFGFLDSTLGAFLNALETTGDVNVIATPRVLCVNKQRAEILIGAQKGYINSTQTETSTTQTVEFLEVGTQLRIRPFISSDGLIRMEVHPELSNGTVNVVGGFTLPEKEVTQVTSNILVRDGCTAIIGGLMREDLTANTTRVPWLGSAPGIGFLFRSKKEQTERHELIVLLTPRIVYDIDVCGEGDSAACDFHRRQALFADQMSPLGTRYLGRKYFRRAQSAWSRGDRQAAMASVKLALHYDPLNRAAITLRAEIAEGRPPSEGLLGDDADAAWIADDPSAGPPLHPLDPGQTGRTRDIIRPDRFESTLTPQGPEPSARAAPPRRAASSDRAAKSR